MYNLDSSFIFCFKNVYASIIIIHFINIVFERIYVNVLNVM